MIVVSLPTSCMCLACSEMYIFFDFILLFLNYYVLILLELLAFGILICHEILFAVLSIKSIFTNIFLWICWSKILYSFSIPSFAVENSRWIILSKYLEMIVTTNATNDEQVVQLMYFLIVRYFVTFCSLYILFHLWNLLYLYIIRQWNYGSGHLHVPLAISRTYCITLVSSFFSIFRVTIAMRLNLHNRRILTFPLNLMVGSLPQSLEVLMKQCRCWFDREFVIAF